MLEELMAGLRGDETGLHFSDISISLLQKLNPGVVDSSRASEILRKLNLLWPSEGNRDALSWLRGEQDDKQNRRQYRLRDILLQMPSFLTFQRASVNLWSFMKYSIYLSLIMAWSSRAFCMRICLIGRKERGACGASRETG
jgi:hypothetical protein